MKLIIMNIRKRHKERMKVFYLDENKKFYKLEYDVKYIDKATESIKKQIESTIRIIDRLYDDRCCR